MSKLSGEIILQTPGNQILPFNLEDSVEVGLCRELKEHIIGNGRLIEGDVLDILPQLPSDSVQTIIADPPYFQVLGNDWDNAWKNEKEYLQFTVDWVKACRQVLREDGLLYVFGQLGKREHVWLHVCSRLAQVMQFHDKIIWDRAVGYQRKDSFSPQYEEILVLKKNAESKPYFDKDAVRIPYDKETIQSYLRDKRYKNKEAREQHLLKGKCATNIIRVPSLKGSSKEKVGHPCQKPLALVEQLIASSSRPGDIILDPFMGSGTTAVIVEKTGRKWIGIEKEGEYIAMTKKRLRTLAKTVR